MAPCSHVRSCGTRCVNPIAPQKGEGARGRAGLRAILCRAVSSSRDEDVHAPTVNAGQSTRRAQLVPYRARHCGSGGNALRTVVLGSGLMGVVTAWELAKEGHEVIV